MPADAAYVPLDLDSIPSDRALVCDLYLLHDGRYVLYRDASSPFRASDRARLLANGISTVWIPNAGEALARQRLIALLAMPDEEVPALAKAGLLYNSAVAAAQRAVAGSITEETLAEVHELIGGTVGCLARSKNAFAALLRVMRHDYSTYTHAVNVAVYALGLASFVGLTDCREARHLGVGAILHDVGKAKVPSRLLNKPAALAPAEWQIVRQHPMWGIELLGAVAELPDEAVKIVAQHHERLDGSGYPAGIHGEDLHPFSTLVALVDAYDAMTCDRPYRRALSPYDALSSLKADTYDKIDPQMFAGMVSLLGHLAIPSAP